MHPDKFTTYNWLSSFVAARHNPERLTDLKAPFFQWVETTALTDKYEIENGILGAGWLIAFLSKTSILKIQVDDYLEEVDDYVYRFTSNVLKNQDDIQVIRDLINYYDMRLSLTNSLTIYRSTPLNQCLNFLVQKLGRLLEEQEVELKLKIEVLLKFSYLIGGHINERILEKCVYKEVELCIAHFRSHMSQSSGEDMSYASMLIKMTLCVKQYGHLFWEKDLKEITSFSRVEELTIKDDYIQCFQYALEKYPKFSIVELERQTLLQTDKGRKALFDLQTNLKNFSLSWK